MRAEFCIFESNAPGLKANFYEPYVDKPSGKCITTPLFQPAAACQPLLMFVVSPWSVFQSKNWSWSLSAGVVQVDEKSKFRVEQTPCVFLYQWGLCALRHGIQISIEAILACHPARSTEWLDCHPKSCELWRIRTGPITSTPAYLAALRTNLPECLHRVCSISRNIQKVGEGFLIMPLVIAQMVQFSRAAAAAAERLLRAKHRSWR